jgi:hypothetical protein
MALHGVCELSSLLRVDDLERSELQRKKAALDVAVKQQEGRVSPTHDWGRFTFTAYMLHSLIIAAVVRARRS